MTTAATTLAINGGEPVIAETSNHFMWPRLTEQTRAAVLNQLDESISLYNRSGIIAKLESRLADYHGAKHALLTSSGTAALHSAFVGADLQPGDEVICPAYTFFASITPLLFTGAVPVLAESTENGNIDPQDIEQRITGKTRAIVVTHMWGVPCDMDPIVSIARRHDLLLIEDASHAHGATYHGRLVGTFGDVSAFSMQAQKTLTGGEGGFLLTDNDEIMYRALLLGHYNKRCKDEIPKDHPLAVFATTGMGLKLRIHPVAAAIADQQLDELDTILEGRRRIAQKMREAFASMPGVEPIEAPADVNPAWYAFILRYKPEELSDLPIDRFYDALVAEGCSELDRPGSTCPLNYHPLFQDPGELFPMYQGKMEYHRGNFPIAEQFHESLLKLPVWDRQEDEELVERYFEAFQKVIDHHNQLLSAD